MNSPITAMIWEIWWRGRRATWLVLGCVAVCAVINLALIGWLHISDDARGYFSNLFGMMMALSFLLLMNIFNYTEYNATKEWNGFPYRLFTLPVATWQLVTVPMLFCVFFAELVFFAWIKLVWTHDMIPVCGWFAIVLGAYVIFYQATLWCLAGFRILRIVALGLGGVSWILVAALPFFAAFLHLPWVTEGRLIVVVIALAMIAHSIALRVIARQRCGGGRREGWVQSLANWFVDALPKRAGDFASPSAAQFWYEWRRVGWLLPACVLFVIALAAPISWIKRGDPAFVGYLLGRLLLAPIVLSLVVGKGFVKCEYWSASLGLPNFLAVRPWSAVEYVEAKMKVAAVSVAVAWGFVFAFLILWLSWANVADLKMEFFLYRVMNPYSWPATAVLLCVGLLIVSWRLMVGGLWVGLYGNRDYYLGWSVVQVLVPVLGLIAAGIWSDAIDRECKTNPVRMQSLAVNVLGWCLASWVIFKFWFAAFAWGGAERNFRRRYLLIWAGGLTCLLALAILASPFYDVYRFKHLCLLAALLGFPLARSGLAPGALAKNRHR